MLASGSSGNAIYIRSPETSILLDAGISGKQISERLLAAAGCELGQLDAVLLTHEHIDHVRGVNQVLKKTRARVYATEGTWSQIADKIGDTQVVEPWVHAGNAFPVGDILVTPFAVSHDAEEPVAYRFDHDGTSLCVLTDSGYVNDSVKTVIRGCQCLVWESNHDTEMLRAGRYPWSVKRRILGDKGHLSNEDSAIALSDVLGSEEVHVYLAHLSEQNNMPDLAELTVQSVLRDINPTFAEQVCLHRTSRQQFTEIRAV